MNNLEKPEKNNFTDEEEKLKYMQTKIHETILECVNQYITLKDKMSLLNSVCGMNFMYSKNSIADNIGFLSRYKSNESVINNISKETLNLLSKLPNNCSKEYIDTAIQETVFKITKDFFGAKLIMGTDNEIRAYCEESDNPNIQQLYKQYRCVQNYLTESENIENSPVPKTSDKKNYIFSKGTPKRKTINVSESFIDKPTDKNDLTISSTT